MFNRTNLLIETISDLTAASKTPNDVIWVGSRDGRYAISWDEFAAIASHVDYNSGYGGNEIAQELVIVGEDWWLERYEYDGAEWWEFKTTPVRQLNAEKFNEVRNLDYNDVLSYVVPKVG